MYSCRMSGGGSGRLLDPPKTPQCTKKLNIIEHQCCTMVHVWYYRVQVSFPVILTCLLVIWWIFLVFGGLLEAPGPPKTPQCTQKLNIIEQQCCTMVHVWYYRVQVSFPVILTCLLVIWWFWWFFLSFWGAFRGSWTPQGPFLEGTKVNIH